MRRVLLSLVMAALACSTVSAAFWDVEPVYQDGFAAGDAALAVGPDSVPSVSYTANGGLYVATRQVDGWSSEFVSQVGYWGGWSSLALGVSSQPSVAFIDASNLPANILKYGYKAATWVFETVDDVGWLADSVSLAFDSAGRPCIAYCRTTESYICFAQRTGPNTWTKQTIARVGGMTAPSLVLGASSVYVACVDSGSGTLKVFSRATGGGWQTEVVDGSSAAPAVWYTSLAAQPDCQPAVAYFINSGGSIQLRLARKSGGSWTHETVATMSTGTGCYCSMVVTPKGSPLIGYYDTATDTFKHAWKSGGAWRTEAVDPTPGAGVRPSLRLDSLGKVDCAYFSSLTGDVRFAWAVYPRSMSEAKSLPDGQQAQLSGMVAATAAGDLASVIYAQEQDRTCGIRLQFSGAVPPVTRGMVLDIQGEMTTIDGERAVLNPLLSQLGLAAF